MVLMNDTRIDQMARSIRSLSVVTVRDHVMDNPHLFPECEGMTEMELTKAIAKEHAHNRDMMAREQNTTPSPMAIFYFPLFLMVGTLVTGVLMLLGY
jgi:hypothetical protein